MQNSKYQFSAPAFYTIGKDFAFAWIEENPDAKQEDLVCALLKNRPKDLRSCVARTTAEQISSRVFHVRSLESNDHL